MTTINLRCEEYNIADRIVEAVCSSTVIIYPRSRVFDMKHLMVHTLEYHINLYIETLYTGAAEIFLEWMEGLQLESLRHLVCHTI